MVIREATIEDWDAIWPIFSEIVKAGDTYGYDPDTTKDQALQTWLRLPQKAFVIEEQGAVLGTYYIKPNQSGPGRHVCNCGYMVSASARGRGLASRLCAHSQEIALDLGYKAMQFNFVASSNERAVRLWKKLGFDTVGTLPSAFEHPTEGYVDAFVMYKRLLPSIPKSRHGVQPAD